MIFERLKADFGALNGAELLPGRGLNLFCAPNEAGKSTWCAFLRCMLYGIRTSQRERSGYLPDKVRYVPWSGVPAAGLLELEKRGQKLTLERMTTAAGPMQGCVCTRTGTQERVRQLEGADCGEILTGVPEEVFCRTALIRGQELAVTQSPELERRIQAIVTTAGEEVTCAEALETLRAALRSLDNGRGKGSLLLHRQEADELRKQLEDLGLRDVLINTLQTEFNALQKQKQLLEGDLHTWDALDRWQAMQRWQEADRLAAEASREVRRITDGLRFSGKMLSEEDLSELASAYASLQSLEPVCRQAKTLSDESDARLDALLAEKARSPFAGLTERETEEKLRELERLSGDAQREAGRPTLLPALALGAGVLAGGALAFFLKSLWQTLLAAGVGFACLAGLILLLLQRRRKPKDALLRDALRELRFPGLSEARGAAGDYASLLRREEDLRLEAERAAAHLDEQKRSAKEAAARVLASARKLDPTLAGLDGVPELLKRLGKALEGLRAAKLLLSARQEGLAMLTKPENAPAQQPARPISSRAEAAAALEATEKKLRNTETTLAHARGEALSSGDPALLRGRLQALEETIPHEEKHKAALELAIASLQEASGQLQTRVTPLLCRTAGELFTRLTGGKYDALSIDSRFAAAAREADRPVSRSAALLSDGTADQLYFCLRLAMCEHLLGGADPCPLILDDPFLSFDDERAAAGLELLLREAETRQIFLFTCRQRERDLLAGRENVTLL